jgi:pimeloyl-ACP methyl ester carboxylesterase
MSDYVLESSSGPIGGVHIRKPNARGTLVLVHGAGQNRHALIPLADAIRELDVVALDLPGRGASSGPPAPSVREAAEMIALVANDPALRAPVIVAGHSLGGAVMLELALTHSVAGLVLLCTGARLRVREAIFEDARAVLAGVKPRTRAQGFGPSVDPDLLATLDASFDEVPPLSTLADWTMANGFDRLSDIGRVSAPTLIVHGDDDPFTPLKYAEHLVRHIPNAELVRIEGGSHMATVERAVEVARAIDAFAKKLPRP